MLLAMIQILMGLLFVCLSILTLVGTKYTNKKFEQLGLPKYFRYVTGLVQFIGGSTMLLGSIWYSNIVILGGAWIAMTMVVGIVLRIRTNDSLQSMLRQ
ncbi:DoxX family protein [Alkalihalophilus lindianensis]|uniref:DoxX family protein n=1 Tax=Alkalihalophilus lindianensis TaxID=1630542 RepID=A0ABU3XFY4_9BACI|nr:DoxX family protein [Alkalihalophilus lindianensis]MDV2686796.1 DoxX family protein [Alkalihalophilus lindianensis]